MRRGLPILAAAAALVAAAGLRAQIQAPGESEVPAPEETGRATGIAYQLDHAWWDTIERDDYRAIRLAGGFSVRIPAIDRKSTRLNSSHT